MAIEKLIEDLIAAVKENTAALKGAGGGKAGAATTKATGSKPTVTFDQVKAACLAVRDHEKGGKGVISKIIKDVGKAESLAKIQEPQFAAVLKKAEEKLDELNAAEESSESEGEDEI